jgi:peptidoglycan hydrolase-like protein with peptidoglycan-binding domain
MKKVMHLVFAGTAAFASAAVLAGGDKMNKQSGAQASPSAQQTSSTSQSQSPETVKKVQEALAAQGYDPGPVDGKLGQRTAQALKQAQEAKNLKATGQLDSQTLAALGVSEGASSSSTATGSSSSGSGASGGSSSSPSSESSSSSPSSGSGSSGSGSSGSGSSEAGAGASGSGASGSASGSKQ